MDCLISENFFSDLELTNNSINYDTKNNKNDTKNCESNGKSINTFQYL